MNAPAPVVISLAGPELLAEERDLVRRHRPAGFILFARNIRDGDGLRRLIADLSELRGGDLPPLVLVDQEGGPVQRLRPPLAHDMPAARRFGEIAEKDFVRAAAALELAVALIAEDLRRHDINADTAPVLDVPVAGADPVIGDRAYSCDPEIAARLGRVVVDALLAHGVLPVIKHIPGHGRATVDTHEAPARVGASMRELEEHDLVPFRALADAPAAMTAHVIYEALDAERPASLSETVLRRFIRADLGFEGLLVSDDLGMGALSGPIERRVRDCLEAGCDLALVCSGRPEEMARALAVAPVMRETSLERLERALEAPAREPPPSFDANAACQRLRRMLAGDRTPEEESSSPAATAVATNGGRRDGAHP